ncbi:MAG: dihydroorotate dehydrogenase electron transfer subunit [Candidatus Bathyarchaeia archaeon]
MSVSLTAANTLRVTRVSSVRVEGPTVKTFTFKDKLCAKARPGQFIMLWIPGVDEIPLSIMNVEKGEVSVAVKAVGEATCTLHAMKVGDKVGVRGPFGSYFTETQGRVLLVGGGTGVAPLLFLAKRLSARANHLALVMGAKTKSELLFLNQFTTLCTAKSMIAATEDGSYGLKCLATEPVETLLKKENFDMIYTCGPEPMIRQIFLIAEKYIIPIEASLERLMRCGIGLCGSCMIGKYRVCKDGPVFAGAQLREVKDELGISKLDFNGKRIHF